MDMEARKTTGKILLEPYKNSCQSSVLSPQLASGIDSETWETTILNCHFTGKLTTATDTDHGKP